MIAIRVTETFLKFAFDWLKTMLGTGKADLLKNSKKLTPSFGQNAIIDPYKLTTLYINTLSKDKNS